MHLEKENIVNKRMSGERHNRRQRKKLHLGEFRELGFEVAAELAAPLSPAERAALVEAFIEEAIEANKLSFGGGLNEDLGGFVASERKRTSATEEDRALVGQWLSRQAALVNVKVGELRDAWYGFA